MDQYISGGMRRADFDQVDLFVADLHAILAAERLGWVFLSNIGKVKATEYVEQILPGWSKFFGLGHDRRKGRGRKLCHFGGTGFGSDDFGMPAQAIAVAMIAIGMGVDNGADIIRTNTGSIGHDAQHVAGQAGIEQCINQQGLTTVRDQTGIGPAPSAIGLKIGEETVASFIEAFFKRIVRHFPLLFQPRRASSAIAMIDRAWRMATAL